MVEMADGLKEQRSSATNIAKQYEQLDGNLSITIVGALHEGNPGDDILDQVLSADTTTLELPSISVNAFQQGQESRIKKGSFWGKIINEALDPVGVNNKRPFVNAIRILDDRVRSGQRMPDFVPDIAIGATTQTNFSRETISDPDLIASIRMQEADFQGIYPSRAYVMREGQGHYVHVNKPTAEKAELSAVVVGGDYMLPTEYFMDRGAELFGDDVGGLAGVELAEHALSHFLRTGVDRGQVNGILNAALALLQDGEGREHKIVHVGGAAHNPNLLGILRGIFKPFDRIKISEALDARMPGTATDKLTLFGSMIPVEDSLNATRLYRDQVAINVPQADQLLEGVAALNKDRLIEFGRREVMARRFEDVVAHDNSAQVEYFVTRNLLSLVPPDLVDGLKIDRDFPIALAVKVMEYDSTLTDKVAEIMQTYLYRKGNFPMAS